MAFLNQVTTNGDIVFGGEAPANMGPPNGGFSTVPGGNTRYFPCIDQFALVIRMNKSTDAGVTWVEQDAANVPVVPADGAGGTGFTEVYQFINACIDPVSKIIYSCYFDPVSFNIALAPFNTATDKWLTPIISTLSYLPNAASQFFTSGSFVTVFRPNDSAVWVWFYGGGANPNDVATVWGAKCLVTGAGTGTWDLALTRLAGTLQDGIEYAQGGAGVDNAGNIHYWIYRHYSGFGASAHLTVDGLNQITGIVIDAGGAGYKTGTVSIVGVFPLIPVSIVGGATIAVDGGPIVSADVTPWIGQQAPAGTTLPGGISFGTSSSINNGDLLHYVIHPDDSIVGPQLVFHDTSASGQITFTSAINVGSNDVMISTFFSGPNTSGLGHVVRALAGDAPVWEDLTPAEIQFPGGINRLLTGLHRNFDGLDYLFYGIKIGAVYEYHYLTSTGIGDAFANDTIMTSGIPPAGFTAGTGLVAMSFNPLAITTSYGNGVHFGAIGMGWFEIFLAPTTATLTLSKTVSPGGQAVATDFILSASGPVDLSGPGGFGPSTVPPGVYNLGESVIPGYQRLQWVLAGGGTLAGDVLTLAAGDVAVVTITNTPIQKPGQGGAAYVPRFQNTQVINDFDVCLSREWRLYNQIDPTALGLCP